MARKLAKNVYVGETLYMAGDTPPKEDADQITNPAAWGDEPDPDPAPDPATDVLADPPTAAKKPAKKTAAKKSAASSS